MYALFGSAVTSPVMVYEKMEKWMKNKGLSMSFVSVPEDKRAEYKEFRSKYKKDNLLLFSSLRDFISVVRYLENASHLYCF